MYINSELAIPILLEYLEPISAMLAKCFAVYKSGKLFHLLTNSKLLILMGAVAGGGGGELSGFFGLNLVRKGTFFVYQWTLYLRYVLGGERFTKYIGRAICCSCVVIKEIR